MRGYSQLRLYVCTYLISLVPTVKGNVYSRCDFEQGFCDWQNTSWIRTEYESPLVNSGPKRAASGSYYIYSHQGETGQNQTAILESIDLTGQTRYCLLFNYHMKGGNVDRLEVKLSESSQTIWFRENDQGDEWICAAINVSTLLSTSRIKIISHTGKTKSDKYDIIGLDNIKLLTPSGSFCNTQGCNATFDETSTMTLPSSTLSATDSSNTEKTTLEDSSWLQDHMPLLIGVPAVVFLISFVIVGACVFHARQKRPKEETANSMDLMIMGRRRQEREDRYREDPTSRDRATGDSVYTEVDNYDYLDIVRDIGVDKDPYLCVLPDTGNASTANGGHPADLSVSSTSYYNDESPYLEPRKTDENRS